MSLISFPIASVICGYCLFDLVDIQNFLGSHKIHTYADVGREAFGLVGVIIVQICLIAYQLGCCCSYMLIITAIWESLIPDIKQEYWVFIMAAFFFLLSFIRYALLIFHHLLLVSLSS